MFIDLIVLRFTSFKLRYVNDLYFWLLTKSSHYAIFRVPELKIGFGYPRQLSGSRLPEISDLALIKILAEYMNDDMF